MRFASINGGTFTPAADIRGLLVTIPGSTNNFYSGIWCPTYRTFDNADKAPQARNSRAVYWKGVSEKMRIEGINANPLEFRRIVFSTPDRIQLAANAPATDQPSYGAEASNNRYWRTTGDGTMNLDYLQGVFAGTRGLDWRNPMTAKTDTSRVMIHSDRRFKVSSGNQTQPVKEISFYDSIERNMTYDDDENGGLILTNGWSEWSRRGKQQNTYVILLAMSVNGGATAGQDTQFFHDIESTVYWHER